jgi:hypothetical protein
MSKQIRLVATVALTLALQAGAIAQTAPVATPASQEVQGLAPQLVPFAGSDANFQNLVNGLSQGVPVTLTTVTTDGFLQTVTFTPVNALSNIEIARTLETARQQLIARGIANPTAEQIGVALAGGNLPTPSGATPVSGALPTLTTGGIQAGALRGVPRPPSASAGTVNPPSNLVVDVRPIAPAPQSTSASSGASTSASPVTNTSASPGTSTSASPQSSITSPVVRFTSDNTRSGNTSDTPVPAIQPSAPPVNSATGVSNGAPSPAAQMQGRR